MSSLWTPDGEHEVRRSGGSGGSSAPGSEPPSRSSGSSRQSPDAGDAPLAPPFSRGVAATPEEAPSPEEAEAMLEMLRREMLDAPAEAVVANHAYGLFELAAIHLSARPPNFEPARLAVDALGCLVEGLGDRLGEAEQPLRDALSQIRIAFVKIRDSADAGSNSS